MSIKTLKQLAVLRKQLGETEQMIDVLETQRRKVFQEQTAIVQQQCLDAFFSYFAQDRDFELDVYENSVTARYLSLEITLTALRDGSPDILRMHIAGAQEVDVYHEIGLSLQTDASRRTAPTRMGGDTDLVRLANRLQDMRFRAGTVKEEISALQRAQFAFVVRGLSPRSSQNNGTETFQEFTAYLDQEFQLTALAA